MKRGVLLLMTLLLLGAQIGCGRQTVSFRKAGDETPFDVIVPPDITPPPCVGADCDDPPPGLNSNSELFYQTPRDSKVDILFVDDNSGSMEVEQSKLGAKFSSFIQGLRDLDWQIGVTTTDVSSGPHGVKGSLLELDNHPGKTVLTQAFNDANSVFKHTIQRPETTGCSTPTGNCPSGNEQPLFATILAIDKRNSDNSGFFRNGVDLAVVVISDEDEMSTGPSNATKPQDVIDKFRSVWGPEKKLSFYGIIVEPGDLTCYNEQIQDTGGTASYGTHVAELARLTGGVTGSICNKDYSDTAQKIGAKVRELFDSFELEHVPEPGTVQVTLTPAQNVSWKVEGNKLIFNPPPAHGTKINVKYFYK